MRPRAARSTPYPTSRSPRQPRKPSGRVKHDEKMTVYVTSQELLDIEHARLPLRAEHGLAVDRGRLVREALSWSSPTSSRTARRAPWSVGITEE